MTKIPLSDKRITFGDLLAVVGKGRILRDCTIKCVDKLSNVKYNNTAIFTTKVLGDDVLHDERITGIVTSPELSPIMLEATSLGVWEYHNPQELFFIIHEHFVDNNYFLKPWNNQISNTAKIAPSAIIADHSVSIGDNCVIEENAVIKPFTVIGKGSRIGSLCDIGSDGFEVHSVNGSPKVIKHGGMVIIGDNVEILAMVKVTRGLSPARNTVINDNVKIDSKTHIAHGVIIGKDTIVTGGVTIAGNVTIGGKAYIGPGSIISNRLNIGEGAYLSIGSVVIGNVKKGSRVSGNFAMDHEKNLIKHLYLKNQIKKENS